MTTAAMPFRSKSEAALFCDPTSLRYLTGVHFTAGTALVGPGVRAILADNRYLFKARRLLGRAWKIHPMSSDLASLRDRLRDFGIRKIYVDTDAMSASHYKKILLTANGVEVLEARGLSDRMRIVKRPGELKILREAVRITDVLWTRLRPMIRPGMTERELLATIKLEAHRLGADEMSFEPIVTSGAGTAEPHAEAGDKKIVGDEPLMVDMGIRLHGYCSDFTRTPFLLRRLSRPPAWFLKFQREVLAVQNLAYALLAGGERSPKIIAQKIAQRLKRRRLSANYLHGLGHGVGMAIHEEPYMTERGPELKDGMVFTVEPGLYRAGLGGVRIEDMACISRGNLEILTKSSKEIFWRF